MNDRFCLDRRKLVKAEAGQGQARGRGKCKDAEDIFVIGKAFDLRQCLKVELFECCAV